MEQGNKSLAGDSGSPVKSSSAVELVIVSSVQQSQQYCSNHKRDYAWRDKSDFFCHRSFSVFETVKDKYYTQTDLISA